MPTFMCIAYGDQVDHAGTHAAGTRVLERGAIAGMSCIEAVDMDEAVRVVADAPDIGCHGVVEIWPLGRADA